MKSIKRVLPTGTIHYINKDGYFHREDGPAVIHPDGSESWYINGLLHREDGHAMILSNGTKHYWLNGKCYSYGDWLELVKDPISRKWREYCEVN